MRGSRAGASLCNYVRFYGSTGPYSAWASWGNTNSFVSVVRDSYMEEGGAASDLLDSLRLMT